MKKRLIAHDLPLAEISEASAREKNICLDDVEDDKLTSNVDNLTFTLKLDVSSEAGISKETLENKIKETIRQIGATIEEEEKG